MVLARMQEKLYRNEIKIFSVLVDQWCWHDGCSSRSGRHAAHGGRIWGHTRHLPGKPRRQGAGLSQIQTAAQPIRALAQFTITQHRFPLDDDYAAEKQPGY